MNKARYIAGIESMIARHQETQKEMPSDHPQWHYSSREINRLASLIVEVKKGESRWAHHINATK